MAIKYTRLGYVALRCKDFENMKNFYVEKLGFKEHFIPDVHNEKMKCTYLSVSEGQFIELIDEKYEGDNDFAHHSPNHFCFELDNYAQVIRDLEAKGIPVYPGPRALMMELSKPYEEIKPGMCGSLCAFIQDPEENDIELMQFTEKSLQKLCDDGGC